MLGVMAHGTQAETVIKRYENRKLYDPEARRYVTLSDLARMIAKGKEVRVVDQRTGEDLSTLVLAQVILEIIKDHTSSIPRQVLSHLIRWGSRPVAAWKDLLGPQEAAGRARAEVERIVSGLLGRGRLTLEEALALRQDVAASVQRIVSEAQHGLEMRLKGMLEREEKEGVHPTLRALKERLLSFDALLSEDKEEHSKKVAAKAPRRGATSEAAPGRRGQARTRTRRVTAP